FKQGIKATAKSIPVEIEEIFVRLGIKRFSVQKPKVRLLRFAISFAALNGRRKADIEEGLKYGGRRIDQAISRFRIVQLIGLHIGYIIYQIHNSMPVKKLPFAIFGVPASRRSSPVQL